MTAEMLRITSVCKEREREREAGERERASERASERERERERTFQYCNVSLAGGSETLSKVWSIAVGV